MIRYANPSHHAGIAAVIESAFGRDDEARLVERLRAEGDAVFEMVALEDEAVAGHILFSRLWADRDRLYVALAPLAVRPQAQRAGIGSRLVRSGLENAREFGACGVLVLGDPAYYGRFGFDAAIAAEVSAPYRGLPAFQALELEPGAFDGPMNVAYPNAFGG